KRLALGGGFFLFCFLVGVVGRLDAAAAAWESGREIRWFIGAGARTTRLGSGHMFGGFFTDDTGALNGGGFGFDELGRGSDRFALDGGRLSCAGAIGKGNGGAHRRGRRSISLSGTGGRGGRFWSRGWSSEGGFGRGGNWSRRGR